jgi:hypothetical protein
MQSMRRVVCTLAHTHTQFFTQRGFQRSVKVSTMSANRAQLKPGASHWSVLIASCNMIIDWDVDTLVPGHRPITDKHGVATMHKRSNAPTTRHRLCILGTSGRDKRLPRIPITAKESA